MAKNGVAGAECPECGSHRTQTIDTGYTDEGHRLRRRRCTDCESASFTTVEVVVPAPFTSLDTHRRWLNRMYARKRYNYQGNVALSHPKPSARLAVQVKVIEQSQG